MSTRHVALLRGINVGTSTRLPMADLRAIVEEAGGTNVATYLQSGNVVFTGQLDAAALEAAIPVKTRVLILTAAEFRAIAAENPLLEVATDPSRGVVTFFDRVPSIDIPEGLEPEVAVLGTRALYQWCPDGISKSKLPAAFYRSLGPIATARNLRTVDALLGML